MKQFIETTLSIDFVDLPVQFTVTSVDEIILPLLKRLTELQKSLGRRILVFVGAPAGAGKSVLLAYLEKLSRTTPGLTRIQALGLDGFHYKNAYLKSHTMEYRGEEITLRSVKGWPETFDIDLFHEKLSALRAGGAVRCPNYDRNLHEPVADALTIDADIVMVEGLWMLYDKGEWARIQALSDYRIMLLSRVPVLRERAVARKIRGGMTPEAALEFFNTADCRAIDRIVSNMAHADLYLESLEDDDLIDLGGRPVDLAVYKEG